LSLLVFAFIEGARFTPASDEDRAEVNPGESLCHSTETTRCLQTSLAALIRPKLRTGKTRISRSSLPETIFFRECAFGRLCAYASF